MTGLEKVTGRILAEAEAEARAIRARAEAECQEDAAQSQAQMEAACERLREAAEKECAATITRGKSSAVMAKRNVMLTTQSQLLNEAYRRAEKEIRNLPADQYVNLLVGMLKGALRRQLESEQESLRLYGEDIAPATYDILLNSRDRKNFGAALLEEVKSGLAAKVGLADASRVRLATTSVDISGGLILRCGEVEENCSLTMMFAEVRRATEAKVSAALFAQR